MAGKQLVGTLLGVIVAAVGGAMYVKSVDIVLKVYRGWDSSSPQYAENVRFFGAAAFIFGLVVLALVFARWLWRDSEGA